MKLRISPWLITALTRHWSEPGSIFPRQPDVAVVAEPTELQVVVAHKGVVRWRLNTRGRATHSSQPHLGRTTMWPTWKVSSVVRTRLLPPSSAIT